MDKQKESGLHFSQSMRIIIFILLFLVLIVVYGVVYQVLQENVSMRRERITGCRNAFALMQEKMEDQLTALVQISSIVHQDPYLRKLAMREYSVVDVIGGKGELEKLIASNRLLVQAYYYVRETQTLFDTKGQQYTFPESEPYFLPFEGMDAQQMHRVLSGEFSDTGLYLLPACRSSSNSTEDVIPVVLSVPYNGKNAYATLLLEVYEDKLLKLILPTELGRDIIFEFTQEDGTLLLSTDDTQFESSGRVSEEGIELLSAQGKNWYLFEEKDSGVANLTFRMYVPEDVIQAGAFTNFQMRLMIACCIGMVLLLCPVLYFWTYQPMRLLIEKLLGAPEEKRGRALVRADYSLVIREIEQLRSNNNSLLWKIDSNMNFVRASLVRHLLEYGQTSEDFLALCQHADLNFQYPYFRLVLIASRQAITAGDISEYVKASRQEADIYVVKAPDILHVLVNAKAEGGLSTDQVVESVSALGIINQGEKLYFARSSWTVDPLRLHLEYKATLEKLSRRIFHGTQGWEETESAADSANRQYPVSEIQQLQESAMNRDDAGVREAVRSIQNILLHESMQDTVAVLAVGDVMQVLQKYTEANLSELEEKTRQKGATAADLCHILQESLRLIEEASVRQEDTLTEEMMLYISEMLESPNLSIATVSEHFGLSESAFSHAFKKRTGGTFAKYVTDLKIQRAKSLLICTDQSIEEIADQLNYASASSFARMFKSETSLTPTQYRRLREKAE